jgi:proteasome lid subunit RPN8/RPN11
VLPAALRSRIEAEGAAAYPNECCGVMLGTERAGRRTVTELLAVRNEFEAAEQYHRFLITPAALLAAEKQADAAGLMVLGFYHSHPDHPARPSEFDRSHAWPFYSYIIVSILRREPAEMTSWQLDETTEQLVPQELA